MTIKKFMLATATALVALPLFAQETYENAKIATEDLNGTARYVGMGGAMDALGADISTISSNPAGIGLFRKSAVSVSAGVVAQQDAQDFSYGDKTKVSFDQIGFVYSSRTGRKSFLNFGFNYHKSRNFNYILSAADGLNNASQNKLTYAKQVNGLLFKTGSDGVPDFSSPYITCNQLDDIYARNLNYSTEDATWYYDPASAYALDRGHKGYVGQYDFNLSGNIDDRVYLGLTVGIHDVNYRHYGEYAENLAGPYGEYTALIADERKIDGTGAGITAGVIFRPVETSPFRVGLSVATPIWYDLTTTNWTQAYSDGRAVLERPNAETYDFKMYTPWKFGLSLGHTVGNYLALGAAYEYADYAHLDTRVKTGGYYDYWYDSYYDESESDREMNDHTKMTLQGVSTVKLGLEYKALPELAIRLGYNYVSPMYKKSGFKNGAVASDGSYYSSATDFTNWQSTNRITCGVGYTAGPLNLDLAYQYSARKGEFMPFMNYEDYEYADLDNKCNPVNVDDKRHQVLLTVGYKF